MTTPTTTPPDNNPTHNERARNAMGRFTRSMKNARRDAAAADYLADHPGTSYRQLAELFGYCDKGEAWRGIQHAKADVARPAVTKLIQAESDELDLLYAEACAILQRNHVTVSHGKVITWHNPDTNEDEPLPDDAPRLAAIRVALDIRKAYQDLHGIKKPVRVDATIHEVTQQDLELQEMLREAQAAVSSEEQQIRDGGDA